MQETPETHGKNGSTSEIIIKILVTDRHTQIRKYLHENKAQINHQFDI